MLCTLFIGSRSILWSCLIKFCFAFKKKIKPQENLVGKGSRLPPNILSFETFQLKTNLQFRWTRMLFLLSLCNLLAVDLVYGHEPNIQILESNQQWASFHSMLLRDFCFFLIHWKIKGLFNFKKYFLFLSYFHKY